MRRLWLDTSVARKTRKLRELARLASEHRVKLLVHPQVHLEMCRHLRCVRGERFSQAFIAELLHQANITVESICFDRDLAERWSKRLNERYRSTHHWEEAKRSTIRGEFGAELVHEPGRMPMTTDWWIALQVEDEEEDRIAVDDEGGQWQALFERGRAMKVDEAKEWVASH